MWDMSKPTRKKGQLHRSAVDRSSRGSIAPARSYCVPELLVTRPAFYTSSTMTSGFPIRPRRIASNGFPGLAEDQPA